MPFNYRRRLPPAPNGRLSNWTIVLLAAGLSAIALAARALV